MQSRWEYCSDECNSPLKYCPFVIEETARSLTDVGAAKRWFLRTGARLQTTSDRNVFAKCLSEVKASSKKLLWMEL